MVVCRIKTYVKDAGTIAFDRDIYYKSCTDKESFVYKFMYLTKYKLETNPKIVRTLSGAHLSL